MKFSNYLPGFQSILRGMFFMSFLVLFSNTYSQKIEIVSNATNNSYRGLSVVNDKVIWISGNNGTVERSIDGGKTFEIIKVKGFEQNDFRDIEAFDANTAVIMAVAEPAYILRTENGGKEWKTVYQNTTKGMFLDAMDFRGKNGVVVGDP
ncbi:MAG: oxidoreductase, partial [Ginsengibacter sp.]